MGCGCGKSNVAKPIPKKFKVTWPDGTVEIRPTRVEAQALVAQRPGGSISTTR